MMTAIFKKSLILRFAVCVLALCSTACSHSGAAHLNADGDRYLESGTIIISHQMPVRENPLALGTEPAALYAPLVGYFPPAVTYLPADNETWLEIDRSSKVLTVFKGKEKIKQMQGEGEVSIAPGDYYLQHKQKQPKWYAPNEYFVKRQLTVPPPNDGLRYRRGALGQFALFPTTTFPIHCGPLWTEDVGGLRVSATDLASIYYMVPIGAPIVVK
jgi:hypothetical protein